jgi:hypothetical protein
MRLRVAEARSDSGAPPPPDLRALTPTLSRFAGEGEQGSSIAELDFEANPAEP